MLKKIVLVVLALSMSGCAGSLMIPKFRQPDKMQCIIQREGSNVGDYACQFQGKYELDAPW